MAVPIALRNLFEGRSRFFMSVGGAALAMLLILVLNGVFAGAMDQVTVYIDRTPFDLVAAQEGVRNLHMTVSFFPSSNVREIERVPGVARVDSIMYATDFLTAGGYRSIAYIMGFEPGHTGGPWAMEEGSAEPKKGEIIIDARVADAAGLGVGDTISTLGHDFRISGLTKGTVSITNSIAFMRSEDFDQARGVRGVVSYALITVKPGEDRAVVAQRINREVGDVTVQSKTQFASSERRVISDMSTSIMSLMNFMGFLIGLAVVGLTVYTTTLSKLREYGILKAIGAANLRLVGIVAEQAAISLAAAMLVALALAFGLAAALELVQSNVRIVVEQGSVATVVAASGAIGLMASVIPIIWIARVDPAEVFRR